MSGCCVTYSQLDEPVPEEIRMDAESATGQQEVLTGRHSSQQDRQDRQDRSM